MFSIRLRNFPLLFRQVFILGAFSIFFFDLNGQHNYNFYRMDVSDGLSHNNVYALHQDQFGYIWIGTGSGLHQYDGEELKSYYSDYNSKQSLGQGYVRAILEDRHGVIWIGSEDGGITTLTNGIFSNITSSDSIGPNNDNIEHIIELPDGTLMFATWGGGINVLRDGKFSYITSENSGLINNNVVDLFYDRDTDILWIGCWDGGLCRMINGEITCELNNSEGFNSSRARTIAKTDDGSIWIGTWGDGLFRYRNGQYQRMKLQGSTRNTVGESKILSMVADGNKLWVGTFGGGVILYEQGKFIDFTYNQSDDNSIGSNFIESTLVDVDGNLWVGTFGGGLSKLEKSHFKSYKYHPNLEYSLSNNFIRSITQYDQNHMMIATRGHGIDLFDGENFTPLKDILGPQYGFSTIFSLLKTSKNEYWFGGTTEIGLYVMKDGLLEDRTNHYGINLNEYNINQIIEAYDGSIWFGAEFEGGLNQIVGDSLIRFRHDPEDPTTVGNNNVMCLYQTKDSTIWVGLRRHGLNSYKDGKFERYTYDPDDPFSLSNDFVYCIFEDSNQNLWVGTEKGLNKLDRGTNKFKRYFTSDGLSNDVIASIYEDDNGYIWLGTHKAITKMDPENERFWNFADYAGVYSYPFNFNVVAKNQYTGELYFGGVNGLVKFNPDEVRVDSKKPKVLIADIRINNESISKEKDSQITGRVEQASIIRLDHQHKSIQFEFTGLNFLVGTNTQFKYQLVGFDKEWQSSGDRRFISYSNLAPGKYTFQVMSSYDGVSWSTPKSIDVIVTRPWWKTIWFIILLVLSGITLVYFIVRWRNRYLEIQKTKLTRLVHRKTEEIQKRNTQLSSTLDELRTTQDKLIKSEKLAALSQVVFNLLHELNSPLGSTKAGIELINRDISLEIEELPAIIESLGPSEFLHFKNFINEFLSTEQLLDVDEERQLENQLASELAELGITNNDIIENLKAIQCYHITDHCKNLLQLSAAPQLFAIAEKIILKYHMLKNTDKAVQRSISILNSLKTYTLKDSENDFNAINVVESIEEALALKNHVFRRGVEVIRNFRHSPDILGNKQELNQVWLNLISNANYAMNYHGTLKICTEQLNGYVQIKFNDNGAGIPPELQEKIFEPFFTTKPLAEGRGIGLDIVKKIIARHQGDVSLQSKPGETVFTIKLPALKKSTSKTTSSENTTSQ